MNMPMPVRRGLAAVALALLVALYGVNATVAWIALAALAVVIVWRARAASKAALSRSTLIHSDPVSVPDTP